MIVDDLLLSGNKADKLDSSSVALLQNRLSDNIAMLFSVVQIALNLASVSALVGGGATAFEYPNPKHMPATLNTMFVYAGESFLPKSIVLSKIKFKKLLKIEL